MNTVVTSGSSEKVTEQGFFRIPEVAVPKKGADI
jgi:hypothetical protein